MRTLVLATTLATLTLLPPAAAVVPGAALTSTAHADTPPMKGVELYTWFDLACSGSPQVHSAPNPDSWCIAALPGTNRAKTSDEIRRAGRPWSAVATVIAGIPRGAEVSWAPTGAEFARPPAPMVTRVRTLARARGLRLSAP